MVRRGGLASKEECAWHEFSVGILAQTVVQDHNSQRVQKLAFVLVDPFDLTIEDCIRVDDLARGGFQPVRKSLFGSALGSEKQIACTRVSGERLQVRELAKIGNPSVADNLGDRAGHLWIGLQ